MNILHTVRSLRVDGVAKVILRNMAHRDRTQFEHHVCSLRDEGDLAAEFRAQGIEPVFLGHAGVGSTPRTMLSLVKLMRRLQIDLVHSNRTLDLGLAGTAATMCGIPVVSSLHWLGRLEDHPHDAGEVAWPARWLEMMGTVTLNRAFASRIIAVSEAVRRSFESLPAFPARRIQVVHPGIDLQRAPPHATTGDALRRSLRIEASDPVVLNVGRLDAVKGQRHLIPMMKRVRSRSPAAKLLIAGEGELRPALTEAINRENLADSIALIGARADVDALLGMSDVLVVASESEAFALPLLEAMRAAKPVVATDVGGVTELVRDGVNGYVVGRADPDALAAAVLRVLENSNEAHRMGEAGRQIAAAHFDVRESVRTLESMYKDVIGKRVIGGVAATRR